MNEFFEFVNHSYEIASPRFQAIVADMALALGIQILPQVYSLWFLPFRPFQSESHN